MHNRRVPLEKRKRTEISCDRCKSRKQKCHRTTDGAACRHCQENNIHCITTQPRKQRIYGTAENVGTRLSLLEGLVKDMIPGADVSNIDSIQDLKNTLAERGFQKPVVERSKSPEIKQDDDESLLQDTQGQSQYIGPASSYFFQMKLRSLLGETDSIRNKRFQLFGNNPQTGSRLDFPRQRGQLNQGLRYQFSPDEIEDLDHHAAEQLLGAYFDNVHADFPIFHEASFRETYESWISSQIALDAPQLCSLLCVFIWGHCFNPTFMTCEQEEQLWVRVQELLPSVIFTSSIASLQALMLAALHLHNTKRRDACWTLTGAAIRIAFAIGLHRENLKTSDTPLNRELRKQLWWTLYGFEQMQVSSHDRPSAIEAAGLAAGCPRESILDMGGSRPPDYTLWSNKLLLILGSACCLKARSRNKETADSSSRTTTLLQELEDWKTALPSHLQLNVLDALPRVFQRPVLLLHIQYHYIVCLTTRSALLYRVSKLSKNNEAHLPPSIRELADSCTASGKTSCRLLLQLNQLGDFNAVAWWDIYYVYSAALIVLLDVICEIMKGRGDQESSPREMLRKIASLAVKHLQNPRMPGTMRLWASVVSDLDKMAERFAVKYQQQCLDRQAEPLESLQDVAPEQPAMMYPGAGSALDVIATTENFGLDSAALPWSQPSSVEPELAQFWQVDWESFGDMPSYDEQWGLEC